MRLQLIFALTMAGALACATSPKTPPRPTAPLALSLPDLRGETADLAQTRGKVVLVDFWATWCAPCLESFPFYAELYERHRGEGLELWAVSVDTDDAAVAAFLEKHPVNFRVLRDPEGRVPERLDLRTMPTAFLVGRDGQVRLIHAGFVDADRATLEAEVVAALKDPGTAVATATTTP